MKIHYDIDTQNDFMNEDGALYVPGAETLKPNIARLTRNARLSDKEVWGSVDAHVEDDPEFEIFPPHCVKGTEGQKKIFVSTQSDRIFEKSHYDIFTNPEFEEALKTAGVTEAIVYGVATDYCVKAAVIGMQERNILCYVVQDAISAITSEGEEESLDAMQKAGAILVTTEQVLEDRLG